MLRDTLPPAPMNAVRAADVVRAKVLAIPLCVNANVMSSVAMLQHLNCHRNANGKAVM